MTGTYQGTIDWNSYWTDADDDARDHGSPSTMHATDVVLDFCEVKGTPDRVADVGCGPGEFVFAVAEAYPETTVVGYDTAEPVLADARERAAERGLENVRFEQATLPAFDPDESFDLVFSYFTLCYVPEVQAAIANLYDAVAEGGHLVCNYPNSLAQSYWQGLADDPEALAEAPGWEDGRFQERFAALLDGESLLSYDRIHEALGTWPQSMWRVVDRPDKQWAFRHFPLVFVPR